MDEEFEWDPVKATEKLRKHKSAFVDARRVFDARFAYFEADSDAGYGEQRTRVTGMVEGLALIVT